MNPYIYPFCKWFFSLICLLALLLLVASSQSLEPTLAQEAVQCQEEYIVQQGDWLSKVTEKYYGDVLAYNLIVEANNAQSDDAYPNIADPDLIETGWTLCIPESPLEAETKVDLIAEEDPLSTEFDPTTGQFSLSHPTSWVVMEHEDGSGVLLANSESSLDRHQQGTAPELGDQVLNISLTPTDLFQGLFMQIRPGSSAAELADTLLSKFGPIEGTEAAEVELVLLEDGREVAIKKGINDHAEGAVILFEISEGVIALSTAVGFPGDYETVEASALSILSSLDFGGTAETLTVAIDPVPPMAGPTR